MPHGINSFDMELHELGNVVRAARIASGLSQAGVAALVGVSRATVNALETGTGDTVSSTVLAVLDVLGVDLVARPAESTRPEDRLSWAAASASTSFKRAIDSSMLERILREGRAPDAYLPHVSHVTSELSDRRLLQLVRVVASRAELPPKRVWRNLRMLADQAQSAHPRWRRVAVR